MPHRKGLTINIEATIRAANDEEARFFSKSQSLSNLIASSAAAGSNNNANISSQQQQAAGASGGSGGSATNVTAAGSSAVGGGGGNGPMVAASPTLFVPHSSASSAMVPASTGGGGNGNPLSMGGGGEMLGVATVGCALQQQRGGGSTPPFLYIASQLSSSSSFSSSMAQNGGLDIGHARRPPLLASPCGAAGRSSSSASSAHAVNGQLASSAAGIGRSATNGNAPLVGGGAPRMMESPIMCPAATATAAGGNGSSTHSNSHHSATADIFNHKTNYSPTTAALSHTDNSSTINATGTATNIHINNTSTSSRPISNNTNNNTVAINTRMSFGGSTSIVSAGAQQPTPTSGNAHPQALALSEAIAAHHHHHHHHHQSIMRASCGDAFESAHHQQQQHDQTASSSSVCGQQVIGSVMGGQRSPHHNLVDYYPTDHIFKSTTTNPHVSVNNSANQTANSEESNAYYSAIQPRQSHHHDPHPPPIVVIGSSPAADDASPVLTSGASSQEQPRQQEESNGCDNGNGNAPTDAAATLINNMNNNSNNNMSLFDRYFYLEDGSPAFEEIAVIGRGSGGSVRKAVHRLTGEMIAIKEIRCINVAQLDQTRREIQSMFGVGRLGAHHHMAHHAATTSPSLSMAGDTIGVRTASVVSPANTNFSSQSHSRNMTPPQRPTPPTPSFNPNNSNDGGGSATKPAIAMDSLEPVANNNTTALLEKPMGSACGVNDNDGDDNAARVRSPIDSSSAPPPHHYRNGNHASGPSATFSHRRHSEMLSIETAVGGGSMPQLHSPPAGHSSSDVAGAAAAHIMTAADEDEGNIALVSKTTTIGSVEQRGGAAGDAFGGDGDEETDEYDGCGAGRKQIEDNLDDNDDPATRDDDTTRYHRFVALQDQPIPSMTSESVNTNVFAPNSASYNFTVPSSPTTVKATAASMMARFTSAKDGNPLLGASGEGDNSSDPSLPPTTTTSATAGIRRTSQSQQSPQQQQQSLAERLLAPNRDSGNNGYSDPTQQWSSERPPLPSPMAASTAGAATTFVAQALHHQNLISSNNSMRTLDSRVNTASTLHSCNSNVQQQPQQQHDAPSSAHGAAESAVGNYHRLCSGNLHLLGSTTARPRDDKTAGSGHDAEKAVDDRLNNINNNTATMTMGASNSDGGKNTPSAQHSHVNLPYCLTVRIDDDDDDHDNPNNNDTTQGPSSAVAALTPTGAAADAAAARRIVRAPSIATPMTTHTLISATSHGYTSTASWGVGGGGGGSFVDNSSLPHCLTGVTLVESASVNPFTTSAVAAAVTGADGVATTAVTALRPPLCPSPPSDCLGLSPPRRSSADLTPTIGTPTAAMPVGTLAAVSLPPSAIAAAHHHHHAISISGAAVDGENEEEGMGEQLQRVGDEETPMVSISGVHSGDARSDSRRESSSTLYHHQHHAFVGINDSNPTSSAGVVDSSLLEEASKPSVMLNPLFASCPTIVRSFGVTVHDQSVFVAMELLDGSLDVIRRRTRGNIPEPVLASFAHDILLGLDYLHSARHIVHRDIKPPNILFSAATGMVKIADFGICTSLDSKGAVDVSLTPKNRAQHHGGGRWNGSAVGGAASSPSSSSQHGGGGGFSVASPSNHDRNSFVGTVSYMSPERLLGLAYGATSDVWSTGIAVLELAMGVHPFHYYFHKSRLERIQSLPQHHRARQGLVGGGGGGGSNGKQSNNGSVSLGSGSGNGEFNIINNSSCSPTASGLTTGPNSATPAASTRTPTSATLNPSLATTATAAFGIGSPLGATLEDATTLNNASSTLAAGLLSGVSTTTNGSTGDGRPDDANAAAAQHTTTGSFVDGTIMITAAPTDASTRSVEAVVPSRPPSRDGRRASSNSADGEEGDNAVPLAISGVVSVTSPPAEECTSPFSSDAPGSLPASAEKPKQQQISSSSSSLAKPSGSSNDNNNTTFVSNSTATAAVNNASTTVSSSTHMTVEAKFWVLYKHCSTPDPLDITGFLLRARRGVIPIEDRIVDGDDNKTAHHHSAGGGLHPSSSAQQQQKHHSESEKKSTAAAPASTTTPNATTIAVVSDVNAPLGLPSLLSVDASSVDPNHQHEDHHNRLLFDGLVGGDDSSTTIGIPQQEQLHNTTTPAALSLAPQHHATTAGMYIRAEGPNGTNLPAQGKSDGGAFASPLKKVKNSTPERLRGYGETSADDVPEEEEEEAPVASAILIHFLSLCLEKDPLLRPCASDMMAHPFMQQRATHAEVAQFLSTLAPEE